MILFISEAIRRVSGYLSGKPTHPRSPKWPAVEKLHLAVEPICQVCGGKKSLNVHHKKPYHLFPELELVDSNLVTLCEGNQCHFLFGHLRDWKAYNENVDQYVLLFRNAIVNRKYTR